LEKKFEDLSSKIATSPRSGTSVRADVVLPEEAVSQSALLEHPRPVQTIDNLQSECFGQSKEPSNTVMALGDVATTGLVPEHDVVKLLEM
jgi:hypothetical protein